ncbi:MAG: acyl-CoA thioesterase [Muribaculaceae bacterium]|nr:acyl-CoA thioesterase [Muribaculaceae bacterium]
MSKPIPEFQHTFHHHTPAQLRFNDIDPLGHVNNTVYFELMDIAKYRYFSTLGGFLDGGPVTAVIVNVNCNFHNQTYLNENLEVLTAIDVIGEKSITLEQRVVAVASGEVKCVCRTVMVCFDLEKGTSVEIPADWRKRISAFEERDM